MSVHSLARSWWLIVLRGLVSALLGLAALVWPNLSLVVLVLLLGVYLLTDGTLAVMAGLTRHNGSQPWWLLIEGSVSIVAGVLTLVSPNLTTLTLLYLIAAWAVITGLVAIVSAIRLRAEIDNEGLLILSGVLSVALGMALVIWPGATILAAVWLIGIYALVSGLLLIGLGFWLWNWRGTSRLTWHRVWAEGERHPPKPVEK